MARVLTKKNTREKIQATVVGYPKDGKTTLIAAALEEGKRLYLIPVDGREWEYVNILGDDRVLVPDLDPGIIKISPRKVLEAVETDVKAGVFNDVGIMSIDSVTPWYDAAVTKTLDAKLDGEAASYVDKASAMRLALAIAQASGVDYYLVWHNRQAGDKNGKKTERESLSALEIARMGLGINVEIEMMRGPKGEYGVAVTTRYRPGMTPIQLWDKPDNKFDGMMSRIRTALFESPDDKPMAASWGDYSKTNPFPAPKQGRLPAAIILAVEHFVEHDGVKFYPFGDPKEIAVKADGSEGTNGAFNHAAHAYEAIKAGKKESDGYPKPTDAGSFAEVWIKYVNDKIQKAITAYDEAKQGQAEHLVETAVALGGEPQ